MSILALIYKLIVYIKKYIKFKKIFGIKQTKNDLESEENK